MATSDVRERISSNMKLSKKLVKVEKNLTVKEQVEISKWPTRILCVQNGGLGNDVSQDELYPLFSRFGEVTGIIMIPRKQYCFISFAHVSSATQAVDNLTGYMLRKGKDPTQDVILYLFYVEKATGSLMPSKERPSGLHIIENFVTEEMEQALLKEINMEGVSNSKDFGVMKHRQVKHFGYEFKYGINDIDINSPLPNGIPPLCHEFLKKAQDLGLVQHFPDQLTINQYRPGQGIPPHIDTPSAFEDGIMSLSLGSQVVIDFRHPNGQHLSVLVPRRSLLVMTGESRYIWSHGITPRKSDIVVISSGDGLTLMNRETRTSFTFRKVILKRDVCKDKSPDSNVDSVILPQNDEDAIILEKQHVHKVYNNIAEHFSSTRYKPWPKVVNFLMSQPPMSLLTDVGCGNGKYLGLNKKLYEVGSDYSGNLASICRSCGFETCNADVTCLPFCSSSFDVVLCIAVIHHMATETRRQKAVSEVVRILRKGGKALIYVWAMEQDYDKIASKYINPNKQKQQKEWGTDSDSQQQQEITEQKMEKRTISEDENASRGIQGEGVKNGEGLSHCPCSTSKSESVSLHCDPCKNVFDFRQLALNDNIHANDHVTKFDFKTCNSSLMQGQQALYQQSQNTADCMAQAVISSVSSNGHTESCGFEASNEQSGTNEISDSSNMNSPLKMLPIHTNRTQFKEQDLLVPWHMKCNQLHQSETLEQQKQDGTPQMFHRFYHVFRQGELETLCKKVPHCIIRKSYYDQGNWCVILEKL